ncbi:hypothetical protein NC652_014922 [Populus alba x Populus x berolinensis]|nr:hypothetical protein NC652_014922 [Populus alba x Populus x berolinensis]
MQVGSNLCLFPTVLWRYLIKFLTIFYSRYSTYPSILLLDEVTSALDTKSEKFVQEGFR